MSFKFYNTLRGESNNCPHFIKGEIKAPRSYVTFLKSEPVRERAWNADQDGSDYNGLALEDSIVTLLLERAYPHVVHGPEGDGHVEGYSNDSIL